jgi:phenylpropionate dioxygenase-like ring-hydroxylating dioxygenase large terminal subunit
LTVKGAKPAWVGIGGGMSLNPHNVFAEPSFKQAWACGPHGLPTDRYTDQDFAHLEAEKLWPRVWQMACRVDQLNEVGSYVVYDIVEDSIVVVRVDEDTIKAYHNVCPHRATALAAGAGRFQLETITCPFHGWKWNLKGENTFALDRQEFFDGCLSDDYLRLHECQVANWMGGVWINMDLEAEPFEQHIAPIKALLDPLLIDHMKFYWHKAALVPANWKVSQEAFMEGYHVAGTHPQLLRKEQNVAEFNQNIEYETFANGHGIFRQSLSPRLGQMLGSDIAEIGVAEQVKNIIYTMRQTYDQHDALVLQEEVAIADSLAESLADGTLPTDVPVGVELQRRIHEFYGAQKRPMGAPDALAAVSDCHIFPNLTFLPQYGNVLMYRTRPTRDNDPNWCIFDMYSLRTYPEDVTAPEWKTDECNDLMDPQQFLLVPRQDFHNIPRQQRGMHSRVMKSTILSARQEKIIMNMHRELDRYLTR